MTASWFRFSIALAWSIRWSLRLLAVFIWVLICDLQYAAAADSNAATLLVVGDSLSAAYGLRQEEGWVELLRARITLEKLHYSVVNASISGETTAGGLSRIADLLERYRPAVVVIALGGNDGLRGTPLNTMRDQLSGMVRICLQRKSRVVLAGVEIPPNYGIEYARDFSATFAAVAKANNVPLVPSLLAGFGMHREQFQSDGMHPIAAAEVKILDTVWQVLRPVLAAKHAAATNLLSSVTKFTLESA